MKTITEFNTKSFLKTSTKLVLLLSFGLFISCEDEIYPEAGSIADKTPPVAAFSASQNEGPEDEWKTVSFKNQSVSATDYSWDFGDGNASTSFEPDNTYSGEGTYTVTLVASDKLNVTNKY
jgi:PKD repeat protein